MSIHITDMVQTEEERMNPKETQRRDILKIVKALVLAIMFGAVSFAFLACAIYAGVMQYKLQAEKYGVVTELFIIPHKSAWCMLGLIPMPVAAAFFSVYCSETSRLIAVYNMRKRNGWYSEKKEK